MTINRPPLPNLSGSNRMLSEEKEVTSTSPKLPSHPAKKSFTPISPRQQQEQPAATKENASPPAVKQRQTPFSLASKRGAELPSSTQTKSTPAPSPLLAHPKTQGRSSLTASGGSDESEEEIRTRTLRARTAPLTKETTMESEVAQKRTTSFEQTSREAQEQPAGLKTPSQSPQEFRSLLSSQTGQREQPLPTKLSETASTIAKPTLQTGSMTQPATTSSTQTVKTASQSPIRPSAGGAEEPLNEPISMAYVGNTASPNDKPIPTSLLKSSGKPMEKAATGAYVGNRAMPVGSLSPKQSTGGVFKPMPTMRRPVATGRPIEGPSLPSATTERAIPAVERARVQGPLAFQSSSGRTAPPASPNTTTATPFQPTATPLNTTTQATPQEPVAAQTGGPASQEQPIFAGAERAPRQPAPPTAPNTTTATPFQPTAAPLSTTTQATPQEPVAAQTRGPAPQEQPIFAGAESAPRQPAPPTAPNTTTATPFQPTATPLNTTTQATPQEPVAAQTGGPASQEQPIFAGAERAPRQPAPPTAPNTTTATPFQPTATPLNTTTQATPQEPVAAQTGGPASQEQPIFAGAESAPRQPAPPTAPNTTTATPFQPTATPLNTTTQATPQEPVAAQTGGPASQEQPIFAGAERAPRQPAPPASPNTTTAAPFQPMAAPLSTTTQATPQEPVAAQTGGPASQEQPIFAGAESAPRQPAPPTAPNTTTATPFQPMAAPLSTTTQATPQEPVAAQTGGPASQEQPIFAGAESAPRQPAPPTAPNTTTATPFQPTATPLNTTTQATPQETAAAQTRGPAPQEQPIFAGAESAPRQPAPPTAPNTTTATPFQPTATPLNTTTQATPQEPVAAQTGGPLPGNLPLREQPSAIREERPMTGVTASRTAGEREAGEEEGITAVQSTEKRRAGEEIAREAAEELMKGARPIQVTIEPTTIPNQTRFSSAEQIRTYQNFVQLVGAVYSNRETTLVALKDGSEITLTQSPEGLVIVVNTPNPALERLLNSNTRKIQAGLLAKNIRISSITVHLITRKEGP